VHPGQSSVARGYFILTYFRREFIIYPGNRLRIRLPRQTVAAANKYLASLPLPFYLARYLLYLTCLQDEFLV